MEKINQTLNSYWDSFLSSIPKIAVGLLLLIIFVALAVGISKLVQKKFQPKTEAPLVLNFVNQLIKWAVISIGLMLFLNAVGLKGVAGGLLAGAGMGAVILGFAFKEIGENFLAGILLVFNRPFKLGDTITVGDNQGVVRSLDFRTTHLKTFDGKDVYLPNIAIITNPVYNHTRDGLLRQDFVIGIDYEDDIDAALTLVKSTVKNHPEILKSEETLVLIKEFATNTVNLEVRFWISTLDYKIEAMRVKTEIMRDVKNALMNEGFGLPANIQEIKLYRDKPFNLGNQNVSS